jgi:hypothetical protein
MKIKKIIPSFSERIWGGQGLKKFGFKIPSDKKIGEAWVISAHENGMGFLEEADGQGESLKAFFDQKSFIIWWLPRWLSAVIKNHYARGLLVSSSAPQRWIRDETPQFIGKTRIMICDWLPGKRWVDLRT